MRETACFLPTEESPNLASTPGLIIFGLHPQKPVLSPDPSAHALILIIMVWINISLLVREA